MKYILEAQPNFSKSLLMYLEIAALLKEMRKKVKIWWKNHEVDDNGLLNNIMFHIWAMTKTYMLCMLESLAGWNFLHFVLQTWILFSINAHLSNLFLSLLYLEEEQLSLSGGETCILVLKYD